MLDGGVARFRSHRRWWRLGGRRGGSGEIDAKSASLAIDICQAAGVCVALSYL